MRFEKHLIGLTNSSKVGLVYNKGSELSSWRFIDRLERWLMVRSCTRVILSPRVSYWKLQTFLKKKGRNIYTHPVFFKPKKHLKVVLIYAVSSNLLLCTMVCFTMFHHHFGENILQGKNPSYSTSTLQSNSPSSWGSERWECSYASCTCGYGIGLCYWSSRFRTTL